MNREIHPKEYINTKNERSDRYITGIFTGGHNFQNLHENHWETENYTKQSAN